MNFKKLSALSLVTIAAIGGISYAAVSHAQETINPAAKSAMHGRKMGKGMRPHGIVGTVSAISGNTITVNVTKGTTVVSYTVDATNAKVLKNKTASTVSAIAVGDTIMVQGTPTTAGGTTITAKMIIDGIPPMGPGMGGLGNTPGVRGTVSAISGTTITVSGANNTVYTVNAASATFKKFNVTAPTIANIAIGDRIFAQGPLSGTTVTATTVIDMPAGVPNDQDHQGIRGTVAAISGNSITVTVTDPATSATTSYTVDATNATIDKNGTAGSIASIVAGDKIMVQGTITGTTVSATVIHDGAPGNSAAPRHRGFFQRIGGFFGRIFGGGNKQGN